MSEFNILFPIPSSGRNADDMGMPVACECGRGDMVTLTNGERVCGDTLRKFELIHGRPYKPCDSGVCEHCEPEHGCKMPNV